jgi:hypothetical protein
MGSGEWEMRVKEVTYLTPYSPFPNPHSRDLRSIFFLHIGRQPLCLMTREAAHQALALYEIQSGRLETVHDICMSFWRLSVW